MRKLEIIHYTSELTVNFTSVKFLLFFCFFSKGKDLIFFSYNKPGTEDLEAGAKKVIYNKSRRSPVQK